MMKVDMNMRRGKQALNEAEIKRTIQRCNYGVLCLCGKEGMPYGVPLNYVFVDECFYFHCAMNGQKLRLILENNQASLTVVSAHEVIPVSFSTDYISVIAFGDISIVEEEDERLHALNKIAAELGIDDKAAQAKEVAESIDHTVILKLTPQRISGKCSGSVVKNKAAFDL